MGALDGKVAVVTGAGRGIGAAVAYGFAQEGADLVLVSRTKSQLEANKARIEALGRKAIAIEMDVSNAAQVEAMAKQALETFGKVDVLVSNAAPPSVVSPIEDMPLDKWRHIQSVNVEGAILLLQALGPNMLERGSGSVIMVSSTLGMNGNPYSTAYGASKAALNHLTKSVAAEWGPRGVRVNGLVPGPVDTERVKHVTSIPEVYEHILSLMPLRKYPVAEDMVGPAVFLAGDASAMITGHLLVVDAGLGSLCREAGNQGKKA